MLKKLYRFLHPRFQTLFLEYPVDMKPRYGHGLPPHPELYSIVNERRDEYKQLLEAAKKYEEHFLQFKEAKNEKDPMLPVWNNDFLPGLDIVMIFTMLAERRPKRYIEVGSGNSTKVAHFAKKTLGLDVQIISIDPQPRAEIDALADEIIRKPFENIDASFIEGLGENDILFIDNSHRILPNSDAMVFFNETLPRLKPGVVVHIHDIYIPYDYPQFMCDRFYSEQYGLMHYILANPQRFRTICPNYFISEDKELDGILNGLWEKLPNVERHGGSYWLRVMG
ncbi:MAG: class I SAM-dependent methyltransferase [Flavobacteriales bacterium]|nr:class I SAM-dependent methyltransferase [Flavobacteriales bacterium]